MNIMKTYKYTVIKMIVLRREDEMYIIEPIADIDEIIETLSQMLSEGYDFLDAISELENEGLLILYEDYDVELIDLDTN